MMPCPYCRFEPIKGGRHLFFNCELRRIHFIRYNLGLCVWCGTDKHDTPYCDAHDHEYTEVLREFDDHNNTPMRQNVDPMGFLYNCNPRPWMVSASEYIMARHRDMRDTNYDTYMHYSFMNGHMSRDKVEEVIPPQQLYELDQLHGTTPSPTPIWDAQWQNRGVERNTSWPSARGKAQGKGLV